MTITIPPQPTTSPAPAGTALGVTQWRVVRAEWIKLRSVRSRLVTLLIGAGAAIALGALFASFAARRVANGRPTDSLSLSLGGFGLAQLVIGVLGVLVTGEYSSGLIRTTFSAVPRRLPVLWAKAAVFAATTAAVMVVMILRIDPVRRQLAVLSLPRDLYLPIAGTRGSGRINSAFTPGDPNQLIQTIEADLGITIDHYAGVDFCAFKSLVDAVGGLSIPFAYPARDTSTGLDVATAGCHLMAGDEALAYVRSRHYSYEADGRWATDTSSDFGRIARQQDFLRRLAAKALARGATNPVTAARLLDVAKSSDVEIDDDLGLATLTSIGRTIQAIGPANAATYRIDGRQVVVKGADVIQPDLTSPTATSVLGYFRGTVEEPIAGPSTPSGADPTTSAGVAGPSSPGTTPHQAVANPAVPDPAVSCQ